MKGSILLILLTLLAAVPAGAQLLPVGPEVRVDTGAGRDSDNVAVSMAPDGSSLVAWVYLQNSSSFECVEPGLIYGRSFDRAGSPLQARPFIVADAKTACVDSLRFGDLVNGRRLVTWREVGGELGGQQIVLAAMGSSGRAKRLREISTVFQRNPGDAAFPLRSGRFLVIDNFLKDKQNELRGRMFSAAGKPLGSAFVIARARGTFISPFRSVDAVETATGDLALAWRYLTPGAERPLVYGAVLNAEGRHKHAVVQLTGPEMELRGPRVASDAQGRFAIVWSSWVDLQTGAKPNVWARLFERNGAPRSAVLNLTPADSPNRHRFLHGLAMGAEGEFVPVWTISDQFGFEDVGAELVNAEGQPVDDEEPLADDSGGRQEQSAISTDGRGLWVTAWTGDGPEGKGIYARLFTSAE
jgi:hypothetical protein